ncbi:hypothetical protein [Acinetobacter bereziniae]|uniref:hypothetical protein n=1 Tax=Acinetobacter bereziniae TaxID=106648 RepID=UPI0021CEE042|nr:hypothetical protein [Acinetobacter bereziniae]MCU4419444.1 hypothetical protein [Acinetobacter bereziniae]
MKIYSSVEKIFLNYNNSNKWEISIQNETYEINLNNDKVTLSLLPFLEQGRNNIMEQIGDIQRWSTFPELLLIKAGFLSESEYWVNLALNWLEASDLDNIDEFTKHLNQIFSNNLKYSQKVRHKTKKF